MTRGITWLCAALLLSACAARAPSAALWQLVPATGMPAAWDADAPSVYLGPVQVPRYVDRPHVMQRVGPSRLDPEAFHRWAEPLDAAATRVLGEDLGRRLASERVLAYPEEPRLAVDYRVAVEVLRLDGRIGETVDLAARWSVLAGDSGAVLATGREDIVVPAGSDMQQFVAAHSEAVSVLAGKIAAEVRARWAK
jgi:uncharacterized lipoprotein YmbA